MIRGVATFVTTASLAVLIGGTSATGPSPKSGGALRFELHDTRLVRLAIHEIATRWDSAAGGAALANLVALRG